MKIPKALIRFYVDYFISECIDKFEGIPEDLSRCNSCFSNLDALLEKNKDKKIFALGLKIILKNDNNFQEYYDYNFPLENEEIRAVIAYISNMLNIPLEDITDSIVISNGSIDESRVERGIIHKVDDKETLQMIAQKNHISIETIKALNPYWFELYGTDKPLTPGKMVKLK